MSERRRAARIALRGLVRKEFRQLRADPRLGPILVAAPIVQLFVFGYAATLDVATARVVVLDRDHSVESRELASRVAASDAFDLRGHIERDDEVEGLLDQGRVDLALVVPAGFGRALAAGVPASVRLVVDGSNSVAASLGLGSAVGLFQSIAAETARARASSLGEAAIAAVGRASVPALAPIEVRSRVWYNPALKSRLFMVPGVLGLVLVVVTIVVASMALVREKEVGTLEQLIVTPVGRSTLLAGKLLPFALVGFADTLGVVAVAHFWFEVPLEGSVLLLVACTVPFLLSTLGMGLLVSTISNTQQQAMMTAMFFVIMPMMYLSGFVFPIESMPKGVQPVTELMPLTHFLVIVRGVMLKGAGVRELVSPLTKLTGLGGALFALAVVTFRKRLD